MAALIIKGVRVLVDDEDIPKVSDFKWQIHPRGYVLRAVKGAHGRGTSQSMHREILGLALNDPRQVDHVNGDRADNRKVNLRICDASENARNRRKSSANTSGFKGVYFKIQKQKYVAQIEVHGRKKHLGYFKTPELAHEFYCLAADMLHGEFANHG
jgi:hypothetical protein